MENKMLDGILIKVEAIPCANTEGKEWRVYIYLAFDVMSRAIVESKTYDDAREESSVNFLRHLIVCCSNRPEYVITDFSVMYAERFQELCVKENIEHIVGHPCY